MNFEGPIVDVIYEKEPVVLEEYLKEKDNRTLEKMIKEPYRIPGIIGDDSKDDPESRIFKILPKFSNREIAEKAQEILNTRIGSQFFAM